jgi:hypothetical protein
MPRAAEGSGSGESESGEGDRPIDWEDYDLSSAGSSSSSGISGPESGVSSLEAQVGSESGRSSPDPSGLQNLVIMETVESEEDDLYGPPGGLGDVQYDWEGDVDDDVPTRDPGL